MAGLAGRVAIVTGASRGIGAAVARRLARDGTAVVIGYARNAQAAQCVASAIKKEGGEAVTIQADMGEPAQIESLAAQAVERFGRLDILVNNAAVSDFGPLEAMDAAFYERMFSINVRGPLLAMRAASPHFGRQGGRIVNISSSITRSPTAQWGVYASSKAALEALTACVAQELGPRNITVNAVAPGVTQTDMLQSVIPADAQQMMAQNTALGRLGQPDDIADVVAFLCSHEARWITGQTLIANGGLK